MANDRLQETPYWGLYRDFVNTHRFIMSLYESHELTHAQVEQIIDEFRHKYNNTSIMEYAWNIGYMLQREADLTLWKTKRKPVEGIADIYEASEVILE